MISALAERARRFARNESRLTILASVILALLLLSPVISYLPGSAILFPLLGALIPLAAIYAVSESRRHLRIGLALGLPAAIAAALHAADPGFAGGWIVLLFPPAFYAYTVAIVAKKVFTSDEVTRDTLAGAACVYLLIGMTWWYLYLLVETLAPGAIAGRLPGIDSQGQRFELLYFSFVTLTTLGYGDMKPASEGAQALAIVESITAVLYLSIAIARLVGMYASQTASRRVD